MFCCCLEYYLNISILVESLATNGNVQMPPLLTNRLLAMTHRDQMQSNFMRKGFCRAHLLKLNNFTRFAGISHGLLCGQYEWG